MPERNSKYSGMSSQSYSKVILLIVPLLMVIALLAVSCKHSDDGINTGWTVGFLRGYVRDDSTLSYIEDATIELDGEVYETSSNGYYTILNVTPGEKFLMAYKDGYDTASTYINISVGDTSYANFFLTPEPEEPEYASIQGFIRNVTTWEFVTAAEIHFEDSIYYSNSSGRYLINRILPGYHTLKATKAGYDTMSLIVDAQNDLDATANFYIRKEEDAPPADTSKVVWTYTNTGSNHIVSIPVSISPTVYGDPLLPGDMIGVFYDSLGTDACAGYAVWDGSSNLPLAVWGDDNTTNEKDGLTSGETFKWKIRRISNLKTYDATATFSSGNDFFVSNGLSILSSLKVE